MKKIVFFILALLFFASPVLVKLVSAQTLDPTPTDTPTPTPTPTDIPTPTPTSPPIPTPTPTPEPYCSMGTNMVCSILGGCVPDSNGGHCFYSSPPTPTPTPSGVNIQINNGANASINTYVTYYIEGQFNSGGSVMASCIPPACPVGTIDFGDGSATQDANAHEGFIPNASTFSASHIYPDPGIYTVTVRITDDLGVIGVATTTVQVNQPADTCQFSTDHSVLDYSGMNNVYTLTNNAKSASNLTQATFYVASGPIVYTPNLAPGASTTMATGGVMSMYCEFADGFTIMGAEIPYQSTTTPTPTPTTAPGQCLPEPGTNCSHYDPSTFMTFPGCQVGYYCDSSNTCAPQATGCTYEPMPGFIMPGCQAGTVCQSVATPTPTPTPTATPTPTPPPAASCKYTVSTSQVGDQATIAITESGELPDAMETYINLNIQGNILFQNPWSSVAVLTSGTLRSFDPNANTTNYSTFFSGPYVPHILNDTYHIQYTGDVNSLLRVIVGSSSGENGVWSETCTEVAATPTPTPTPTPPPNTTTGGVPVPLSTGTVTFADVSIAGDTTVTTSSTVPTPPSGYSLGDTPTYYDVTTTAAYSGGIDICFNYDAGQFADPNLARLLHFENNAWADVTTTNDTTSHTICGHTTTLSPFVVVGNLYNFLGFNKPVDNLPIVNKAKAGQAIPIKWALKDAAGNYLSDVNTATAYGYGDLPSCAGTTSSIDEYVNAGSTSLRYDSSANQFILNSKSDSSWAGTCKMFVLKLLDGTTHLATFQFTK